jgi:hypothetical protein
MLEMVVSPPRLLQQVTELICIFHYRKSEIQETCCILQMAEGKDASVGISFCMDHLYSSTGPYPASSHLLYLEGKSYLRTEDNATT